jgi:hypothetical protein
MNERVENKRGMSRLLHGVFQDWVFQAALAGAVAMTVIDSFASLSGSIYV